MDTYFLSMLFYIEICFFETLHGIFCFDCIMRDREMREQIPPPSFSSEIPHHITLVDIQAQGTRPLNRCSTSSR